MFNRIMVVGLVIVSSWTFVGGAWGQLHPNPATSLPAAPIGPIFYVDALHGQFPWPWPSNTTLTGGGLWDIGSGLTTDPFTPRPGPWRLRSFVNFDTAPNGQPDSVYQNLDTAQGMPTGTDGATPRLKTTISDLSPGIDYYVYVYFWTDTASWRIRAGFDDTLGPLPLYAAHDGAGSYQQSPFGGPVHNLGPEDVNVSNANNQTPGNIQYFDITSLPLTEIIPGVLYVYEPVTVSDGNRRLMEGFLGVGTANAGGEIEVFIDDDDFDSLVTNSPLNGFDAGDPTTHSNYRTWYEGVGYTPALPGSSQYYPIVTGKSPAGVFFDATSGLWYDLPFADQYDFAIADGSLFTLAGMPEGFDSDFEVLVGGDSLGFFAGGTQVDFVTLLGYGVGNFTVQGIDPPIDLEAGGFPIYLEFDTDTATFTMAPVPEPATLALLGASDGSWR